MFIVHGKDGLNGFTGIFFSSVRVAISFFFVSSSSHILFFVSSSSEAYREHEKIVREKKGLNGLRRLTEFTSAFIIQRKDGLSVFSVP